MTTDPSPVPVIIDTDPGVDDVLAILLALSSPHLLILGITLTHGNTTLPATLANLEKLFYALERQLEQHPEQRERWKGVDTEWRKRHGVGPIEVYLGSEGPVKGKAVTAKYFHGRDGLANIDLRHPDLTPPSGHRSPFFTVSSSSALDGVTTLLNSHPAQSVAYLALGPLTSLAQLHLSSPTADQDDSLLSRFSLILSMGGAVAHPGNTTPVAEFNVYADAFAAETVFSLALPNLYLFPLDITTTLTLPFSLYQSAVDPSFSDTRTHSRTKGKSPLTHFTSSFLEGTKEVMARFGGEAMELHDPTVVYALIEWARARGDLGKEEEEEGSEGEFAPGWGWEMVEFEVETTGTLTRGMLVRDLRVSARSSSSLSARTGLTNRAEAVEVVEALVLDVEEVEARHAEGEESLKEVEERTKRERTSGARVVVSSPGSERMREELLRSVWGVEAA